MAGSPQRRLSDPAFRRLVDRVRAETDLARLVAEDRELRRVGSVFKARSPRREDEEPSLVVWPQTQTWRDYSGGADVGGDCFDYLAHRDGLSFMDALDRLARDAGVALPWRTATGQAVATEPVERPGALARRAALMTAAARHYHRALTPEARALYVERYGFTAETIDRFVLGWADGRLIQILRETEGATDEELLHTGLVVRLRDGQLVDFFQGRLVFPYWSGGAAVYFAGRKTERTPKHAWERPKYRKLPVGTARREGGSRVQNATLFNEDAARGAELIVVTEGLTDCVAAAQAGFASVSPATTQVKKRDVRRVVERAREGATWVVVNDSERSGAGLAGARKTLALLHAAGAACRLGVLPRPDDRPKRDVNDLVREDGPAGLRAVVDAARPYASVLLDDVHAGARGRALSAGLRAAARELGATTPIERRAFAEEASARFEGVAVDEVLALFETAQRDAETHRPRLRGEVWVEDGRYFALDRGGQPLALSNFLVEPTAILEAEEGVTMVATLRVRGGAAYRDRRLPYAAWNSARSFFAALGCFDTVWSGADEHLRGLQALLRERPVPKRAATTRVGLHEAPEGEACWVTPHATWGVVAGAAPPAEAPVYLDSGCPLARRLRRLPACANAAGELAARVLPLLLRLNTPEVMAPALGWFFAAPLRPRLQAALGHFPLLCVWGSQGSGKTSLVTRALWPLVGVGGAEPFSVTNTEFATLRLLSATDSVPVVLDEYRPSDMPRQARDRLHRLLRRAYVGDEAHRGLKDLGVARYRLTAPICLVGEARPTDPALVERLVTAHPKKTTLMAAAPEAADAFAALLELDVGALARPLLAHLMGRATTEDLAEARRLVSARLSGEPIPMRVFDGLAVAACGLLHLWGFAAAVGVDLGAAELHAFVGALVDAVTRDLLEHDGRAVKSTVDAFVEALSGLARRGRIQHGREYHCQGDRLALNIPSCRLAYAEHVGGHGERLELDARALTRQLKENLAAGGYVTAVNKVTWFGGGQRVRAAHVDMTRARACLEIDAFPGAALSRRQRIVAPHEHDLDSERDADVDEGADTDEDADK